MAEANGARWGASTFWLALLAIVAVGLAFRLPEIATRSLWIDELYSQWFASRSYVELWRDVPQYETHPPIYYTLLKAWSSLFGETELGLRSLSLLASLATIAAIGLFGHRLRAGLSFEAAGLIGALLLALNYANIRDAQNVRPYGLQTLFITLAILAALTLAARLAKGARAMREDRGEIGGALAPALLLGLSTGVSLLFHNTSFFIAMGVWAGLALSLFVVPAGQRLRAFLLYAGAGVLALLVYAPYAPIFLAQSKAFMHLAFWLTPKPRDLYSAWLLVLGDSWGALALAIALILLGLARLYKKERGLALIIGAVLLLPLYSLLAVSFLVKPVYIQRLFDWMTPLALLVVGVGLIGLGGRRWPGLAVLAAALGLSAYATIIDFSRPIDDWKMIAQVIADNARPGDVVIAAPTEGSIALDYYARRHPNFPPMVVVPGPYPQRGLDRTYMSNLGAPAILPEDRAPVEQALARHGRVWLVQVSIALYDPKSYIRSTIEQKRHFVRYYGNALAKVELFE